MAPQQPPLADIAAEQAVLGSLFYDGADFEGVLSMLEDNDFYRQAHRYMFVAAIQVYRSGAAIDAVAMLSALTTAGVAVKCGGAPYLAKIMQSVPHSVNAMHYAGIVKRYSVRRQKLQKAREMAEEARNPLAEVELDRAVIEEAPQNGVLDAMEVDLVEQEHDQYALRVPWSRLEDATKALRRGNVVLIAGPPGTGKSFFAVTVALAVHGAGAPWRYLPLEDRRSDLQWRILGVLEDTYDMTDDDRIGVAVRAAALQKHDVEMRALSRHICDNPRLKIHTTGRHVDIPKLTHIEVLDWMSKTAKENRVIFIDPISQIDFVAKDQWKAEQDFVRHVLALAAHTQTTIILVAHLQKRPGKAGTLPPILDDIQGSAMWGRLAHVIMLLDAHDEKESSVYRPGNRRGEVQHDRTVYVVKTRKAKGSRMRFAFVQDSRAPKFQECGVISPKGA